jgi:coatomer subunit delta
MSRVRIEGLLAAFPKLVGSGKQHTYIETENVRYVYQPLEVSAMVRQREDDEHNVACTVSILCSTGCTVNTQMWCMQALYLLLVTNKGSNILEDLETLRLLAKVVPEYVDSVDEEVSWWTYDQSLGASANHTM